MELMYHDFGYVLAFVLGAIFALWASRTDFGHPKPPQQIDTNDEHERLERIQQ